MAAASSLAPPGPVSIERISQYHPGSWGLERRKADAQCISPMELHAGRLWTAAHCTGVSTCGYIAGPQTSAALVVPRPPGESWAASAAWMRTAGCMKSDRPCPQGALNLSPDLSEMCRVNKRPTWVMLEGELFRQTEPCGTGGFFPPKCLPLLFSPLVPLEKGRERISCATTHF